MLSVGELHRLALTLPQSSVRGHHGRDSFRVAGKIFATVPDEGHVRIMLDVPGILAAVAAHPGVCEPTYWGKRLACVSVDLAAVDAGLLLDLLTDAWERKSGRPAGPRLTS